MSDYKQEAINFLVYSYFGIAPDYSLEKCVKYAIIKAYEDATAQGAYNTLFSTKGANKEKIDEINSLKKKSEAAKNSSAKIIFKNIDELFRSDNENYNVWHNMVCTEVVTEYENVKNDAGAFFAYGNAQKWINMTVKYICVLDALLPDKVSDYHCYIEKHFNEFHVPVDSYIIEAIWGNEDIELPAKADINRKNEKYDTSKVEP